MYFGTNANIVNSVYGDANYKGTVIDANGRTDWSLDDVNTCRLQTEYLPTIGELMQIRSYHTRTTNWHINGANTGY